MCPGRRCGSFRHTTWMRIGRVIEGSQTAAVLVGAERIARSPGRDDRARRVVPRVVGDRGSRPAAARAQLCGRASSAERSTVASDTIMRIPSYDDLTPSIPDITARDTLAHVTRILPPPETGRGHIAGGDAAAPGQLFACLRSTRPPGVMMAIAREFSPRIERHGASCGRARRERPGRVAWRRPRDRRSAGGAAGDHAAGYSRGRRADADRGAADGASSIRGSRWWRTRS